MGCPLKDMIQAVEGNFWPTFVNLGKFTGSSEHPCWRATLMATLLQGPQLPLLLAGWQVCRQCFSNEIWLQLCMSR